MNHLAFNIILYYYNIFNIMQVMQLLSPLLLIISLKMFFFFFLNYSLSLNDSLAR